MKILRIASVMGYQLEILVEESSSRNECWIVCESSDRILCDHFYNEEPVSKFFRYSDVSASAWQDFDSNIPSKTSKYFEEDLSEPFNYRESQDILKSIHDLPVLRKIWNTAKKSLVGVWENGESKFELKESGEFVLHSSGDRSNLKFSSSATEWDTKPWTLLLRDSSGAGSRMGIYSCNEKTLQLSSFDYDVIVEDFSRVSE